MGQFGYWWFYQVRNDCFPDVKTRFDKATRGVSNMRDVLIRDTPKECLFDGKYIYEVAYHEPFEDFAYQLFDKENSLLSPREDLIGLVGQSRVLPPIILYVSLGKKRFSELPGFFGNMLLHSSEIERTATSVSATLNIDQDTYHEMAIMALEITSDGVNDTNDALKILRALPDALKKAKDNGTGLLALTSWGSP